jgi:hypothetical protein
VAFLGLPKSLIHGTAGADGQFEAGAKSLAAVAGVNSGTCNDVGVLACGE